MSGWYLKLYRQRNISSAIIFAFHFHFDGGLLSGLATANFVLCLPHRVVSCYVFVFEGKCIAERSKAVNYLNVVWIENCLSSKST